MSIVLKKSMAIFLAFCMIISLCVLPAKADGEEGNTIYVSDDVYGDDANDGLTEDTPLLNIATAYSMAEDGDTIVLLTDFELTNPVTEFNADKTVTIDGKNNTITYVGDSINTTSGAIFKINAGAVYFQNMTIDANTSTTSHTARAIYAAGSAVTLENVTITGGHHVDNTMGGGAIYVASGATVVLSTGSVLTGNVSEHSGGAVFVSDGGTFVVEDDAEISDNTAETGAGIYVANGGTVMLTDEIAITDNVASIAGGGIYAAQGSTTYVSGDITVADNEVGNIYLQNTDAATVTNDTGKVAVLTVTGDISGADIGITCQNPNYYRLVADEGSYSIEDADEAGMTYDDGTYDIRLMTYEGTTGLYLYYFTIPVTYDGTENLSADDGITGEDINGETIAYPSEVPVDEQSGDGYELDVTADDDTFRIPEEVTLTADDGNGNIRELVEGQDYTWEPDYDTNTGKIVISQDTIDEMAENGESLNVEVTADEYFTMSVYLNGVDIELYDYYDMADDTSDTNDADVAIKGYTVVYDTANNPLVGTVVSSETGEPVEGAAVYLFDDGGNRVTSVTTGSDGRFDFTASATSSASSYYITVSYSLTFRTIEQGYIYATVTAYDGNAVPSTIEVSGGLSDGDYTYTVAADGKSAILIIDRNMVQADTNITIATSQIAHTITFDPNGGSVSPTTKNILEGASNYGELPTPTCTGYTFIGWYTEQIGGDLVSESTAYTSTDDETLYAHWEPNGNVAYAIRHWVEYVEDGVNAGYDATTGQTTVVDDVTYYLYQTDNKDNGVADNDIDISCYVLSEMTSADYDWWTIEGFTFNEDASDILVNVNADGSSVYNMYYDRNTYTVTLDDGDDDTPDDEIEVKFGEEIGNDDVITPDDDDAPKNPGYTFDYWENEDGEEVTPETIYDIPEDSTLTPVWVANTDTVYVVHYMLQDIIKSTDSGRYIVTDTYSEVALSESYDEVAKELAAATYYFTDDESAVACYFETGTTAEKVELAVAPAITGFNYSGFESTSGESGDKDATITLTVGANDADAGAITDADNVTANGTVTNVYLYYDRVVNSVSYDPAGGDLDDKTPGEIPYGGDFENQFPDDPDRPGYDFDGWVDPDGDPVDENTPTDEYTGEDGELELEATWEPRDYQIVYVIDSKASFNAGDGGNAETILNPGAAYTDGRDAVCYTDGRVVTYDETMGDMPTASKTGYTFNGWFIDDTDDSTEVTSDTLVTIDTVVIKNDANTYEDTRPLYGVFTPNQYVVSFDSGVGGSACDDKTVTFDQPYGELPVPTMTGYTFTGWYTDPTDPTTLVEADDIYDIPNNITLYACWTPNDYRYTFNLNDVEYGNGSTKGYLITSGIIYEDIDVTETYDYVYENVFKVEATREGYTFDGWSLEKDGDILTADQIVSIADDATLYAQWTPIDYSATFVVFGNIDVDERGIELPAGTVGEYLCLFAFTFDEDYCLNDIIAENEITVPTIDGYVFSGWYIIDESGEIVMLTDDDLAAVQPYTTADNLTLYGYWTAVITIDPNGDPFSEDSDDPFTPGSTDPVDVPVDEFPDELPTVDPDDGYTQDGWEDEDGNPVDPEDLIDANEPTVIIPSIYPNVIFDAGTNKGTVNGEATYSMMAKDLTADNTPTATRSGYTFTGWFTAASGGTAISVEEINATETPVTVYAQFKVKNNGGGGGGGGGSTTTYTITASADDGATVDPSGTTRVTAGNDQTITITLKSGYAISQVLVDGESVGRVTSYTFENVSASHTLEVTTTKGHGISWLTEEHIAYIYGYAEDGLVHPDYNLTRGQFAAIIYRLIKLEVRSEYETSVITFSDLSSKAWYATEVETLRNAGIVEGTGDNAFEPERSITRAEMVAMIARLVQLDASTGYTFTDVGEDHWVYSALSLAVEEGWVEGYEDGSFRPDNAITRAEAIAIMNRVMDRDNLSLDTFLDGMKTFPDNLDTSKWYYLDVQEAANGHDFKKSSTGEETWLALDED